MIVNILLTKTLAVTRVKSQKQIRTTMSKNMKKELLYFQFPLCWNQKIIIDPNKSLDQAISYGIFYWSLKLKNEIQSESDRIRKSCEFFSYQTNIALTKESAKDIYRFQLDQEKSFGPQPITSVKRDILHSFRNNPSNLDLFLAYVAVKSLIGYKSWQRTTKLAIISRMVGAKNKTALDSILKNNPKVLEFYSQYVNEKGVIKRYKFDKLICNLQALNFIQSYFGLDRSVFFSLSLTTDQLADTVKAWKLKKNYQAIQRTARQKINGPEKVNKRKSKVELLIEVSQYN